MLSPVGFHFIMLLKSCVSCSSAQASLSKSSCDCATPGSCDSFGCVSPSGVDAALAFAFFRGGIVRCNIARVQGSMQVNVLMEVEA